MVITNNSLKMRKVLSYKKLSQIFALLGELRGARFMIRLCTVICLITLSSVAIPNDGSISNSAKNIRSLGERAVTTLVEKATATIDYMVYDFVPFDRGPIDQIANDAILKIRTEQEKNRFLAYEGDQSAISKENNRKHFCSAKDRIFEDLKSRLTNNCRLIEIRDTCIGSSEEIFAIKSEMLSRRPEVLANRKKPGPTNTKLSCRNPESAVYSDLKVDEVKQYLSIIGKNISPPEMIVIQLNMGCSNVYKDSLSSPGCLDTYKQVFNDAMVDYVANSCTETSIRNLVEDYVSFMSSRLSPFWKLTEVNMKREEARKVEFDLAQEAIAADDYIKASEQLIQQIKNSCQRELANTPSM